MKLILSFTLSILVAGGGCDKVKLPTTIPVYFPIDNGMTWCYETTFMGEIEPFEKVEWKIAGDTTLDGKVYKVMTKYGERFKAIREEDGDYYKRKISSFINTTDSELHFLRTKNPEGAIWEQVVGDIKYNFSQTLLNEYTLGENKWEDVIQVKAQLSQLDQNGEFQPLTDLSTNEPSFAIYHFAKGIGIVHMSEPPEFNHFSDFAYSVSNEMNLVDCP